MEKYSGTYSKVNGAFVGTDDLGRQIKHEKVAKADHKRDVGIFYFQWIGEHGTNGPYDNSAIVEAHPEAITSEEAWLASGGGKVSDHHFWGKPLFGYYRSSDEWVILKHLQMLVDADIDFLVFDTTNAHTYQKRFEQLLKVWYEYLEKGVNVPKLVFYTNSASGRTMDIIFDNIYCNKELREKYPRIDELWYIHDGKPMIIGVEAEASEIILDYFTFKESTWPNAGRTDNGFPWMEFDRLLTKDSVYGRNGRKEVMNVSVAQHSDTCRFSSVSWYKGNDRTRCWHNGANDKAEDAILWGYNFAEQWEYALKEDPEMIFVTGWNEWVAQRQPSNWIPDEPIFFVDCATYNGSRDVEPAACVFGDNYYMQMCEYIRRYKGTTPRVYVGDNLTIDVNGDFSQWDSDKITACYTDYADDTKDRNAPGFGTDVYTNTTGRNDFVSFKVAKDEEYIYFYAQTAKAITPMTDNNWMTLFINTGKNAANNWYGYDYAVNLEKPLNNSTAVLSKNVSSDEADNGAAKEDRWLWEKAGEALMKVDADKLMLAVKLSDIGIVEGDLIDIQFKWADNYQMDENGKYSINTFYIDGDSAPYGRLNYLYSEKA